MRLATIIFLKRSIGWEICTNMYFFIIIKGKHVNKNEAKAQEYIEKGKALERKNPNKLNSSSS